MKSFIIVAAAALAGLASAQPPPTETLLSGKLPIYKPAVGEKVPVGKPYTITWGSDPDCKTVDIIFLKGPPTNVLPVGTIAAGAPDSGTYAGWIPDSSLPDSTEGYAIKLLCTSGTDAGGYQWSSQFGFLNLGGGVPPANTTVPVPLKSSQATTTTTMKHPYPSISPTHGSNSTISTSAYPSSSSNMSYPTHTTKHENKTTTAAPTKPTKKPTEKPTHSVSASSGPSTESPTTVKSTTAPSTTNASGAGGITASSGMALVALVVAGLALF